MGQQDQKHIDFPSYQCSDNMGGKEGERALKI